MIEEFREEIAGGAGAGDPAGRDRRDGRNINNIARYDTSKKEEINQTRAGKCFQELFFTVFHLLTSVRIFKRNLFHGGDKPAIVVNDQRIDAASAPSSTRSFGFALSSSLIRVRVENSLRSSFATEWMIAFSFSSGCLMRYSFM